MRRPIQPSAVVLLALVLAFLKHSDVNAETGAAEPCNFAQLGWVPNTTPCPGFSPACQRLRLEAPGSAKLPREVHAWARRLARINMATLKDNVHLGQHSIDEAYAKVVKVYRDRIALIKVKDGQLYVIVDKAWDTPEVQKLGLPTRWLDALIHMLATLISQGGLPDFEALFTCAARANDTSHIVPNVPIFAHCYDGILDRNVIPFPRSYSLLTPDVPKDLLPLQDITQALLTKDPRAYFRGALSSPSRLNLFRSVQNHSSAAELFDIKMTLVPEGAPCLKKPWNWCLLEDGPRGWAARYGLATTSQDVGVTYAQAIRSHRFAVITDGVGCPDRLGEMRETFFGGHTLILFDRSPLQEFWYGDLIPYTHYVPLSRSFADLPQQVSAGNEHLRRSAGVIQNAHYYGAKYMQANAWRAYAKEVIREYAFAMHAAGQLASAIRIPQCAVKITLDLKQRE